MDLSEVAVLPHHRRTELDTALVQLLVGRETLRSISPLVADLPPEECGWKARRALAGWLQEVGWVPMQKGGKGSH